MFNFMRKKEPASPTPPSEPRDRAMELRRALQSIMEDSPLRPHYPIQAPIIPKGVVPEGVKPQVAMDAMPEGLGVAYPVYANFEGFPGYPTLAQLALRSEYRNMASALATELTRKWIKFNSSDTHDESTKEKITAIEAEFKRLGVQQVIRKQAEHDALYGTGQILINIKGADTSTPLIVDKRTIQKGRLEGFKNVEPIWTTPLMYDALNPASPSFYKPSSWWVMGVNWDSTRLLIVTTREVPDMFKPAFNFSGISLSQLAEPYVNNWLRTRQSVSDLINNFSILVLKIAMDQQLASPSIKERVQFFLKLRSNKGLMVLDKEREELEQLAVPLGGLRELQSQAQEQMCCPSNEPAVIMTGISPAGFGNVAQGEMQMWHERIHGMQEAFYRSPIEIISKLVQLSLFGEIDESISFEFEPLEEMTEEQMSTIRTNDSVRAGNLIDRGVIDPQEERERLARDPDSGYNGIDIEREIAPPDEAEESAQLGRATDSSLGYDSDFVESEHPRAPDGRFGDKPGEHTPKQVAHPESVEDIRSHLKNNKGAPVSLKTVRWELPGAEKLSGARYSLIDTRGSRNNNPYEGSYGEKRELKEKTVTLRNPLVVTIKNTDANNTAAIAYPIINKLAKFKKSGVQDIDDLDGLLQEDNDDFIEEELRLPNGFVEKMRKQSGAEGLQGMHDILAVYLLKNSPYDGAIQLPKNKDSLAEVLSFEDDNNEGS